MIDIMKVLRQNGYRDRKDYTEIARWCGAHLGEFDGKEAMLEAINARFGPPVVRQQMLDHPATYRIWKSPALPLEDSAIAQLETALSLPMALGGAGMPDMHLGYSMPIGGVAVLENAISPAFVGYDISCMMMLTIFDTPSSLDAAALAREEIRDKYLQWTLRSTSFGLGAQSLGAEHAVMDDRAWRDVAFVRGLKDLAASQVGSSGAGNHFADIVAGSYEDGSGDFVALLTHSGSRGVGNKVGHYYAKLADEVTSEHADFPKGYGWFELGSDLGEEYLRVMTLMGDYAHANHELIHQRFAEVSGLAPVETHWNRHNYAWVDEHRRVVHRKGATPAEKGQIGIIPGSSGSDSYLVVGKGNEASYQSASHGAGRPFSRTAAKKVFDQRAFSEHMSRNGITYHGVAPDESVAAYKDIHEVMAAQSDLVEVVAKMRPRVVVMGGGVSLDDGD